MKYSNENKPMQCMMRQSTCYKGTREMNVVGVLWHSTGANNPYLSRYVQPDDNDPNRAALIAKLGTNRYGNDWNHIEVKSGLNCWIGKLNDETVTTVQTMPWNYRPWGCGSGSKGSCNNGWIQFEICEDGLSDANYFNKVYKEACEITAYLCKMFNIDPNGSVNGIPTILCHHDSYKYGLGSNHGDVDHWFPKFGKSMATARADVAKLMKTTSGSTQTPGVSGKPSSGSDADSKELWNALMKSINNEFGVAGLMGNLYAESALKSNNLQNTYEKSLGYTDDSYTKAVDNGNYGNFVHDSAGYGLAQWTFWRRKEGLLNYAKSKKVSVGDFAMQTEFLLKELATYKILDSLKNARSVKEASNVVLLQFEKPADQSTAVQEKRAGFGMDYYNKFANKKTNEEDEDMTLDTFKSLMQQYRAELQDNDAGVWSKEARDWAVNNGIIQGGSSKDFNGMWQDNLSREQMVVILYRFAQLMGKA